jgi:hypothetical protein
LKNIPTENPISCNAVTTITIRVYLKRYTVDVIEESYSILNEVQIVPKHFMGFD